VRSEWKQADSEKRIQVEREFEGKGKFAVFQSIGTEQIQER